MIKGKLTRDSFHVFQANAKNALKQSEQIPSVLICAGTGCIAGGSMKIYENIKAECEARDLPVYVGLKHDNEAEKSLHVKMSGCHGFCEMGPLVHIEPMGILYIHVKPEDCHEIIEKTVLGGEIIDRLVYHLDGVAYPRQEDIPFYKLQHRVVLENCGTSDAEDIEEYIRDAGSKSALNSALSSYGVNVDMLRDLYELEAKYAYLQAYLYGAEGEKIAANVRYDYLTEHAVCFKQVLIRAFDYVYETDNNGDEIYYKVGENNAKINNIAYDTVNGFTRVDEFDKTIVDKNGDAIYYLPNGSIAYDKVNGVRSVVYDANGVAKTVKYSAEELAEHKAAGEEIMASVTKGDYAAFEALLAEYEVSGDDAFVTDSTYCFLYTTGDNDYDYLNDIADVLAESEEGVVRMVSSEYGYNVVMKYPIPQDAVTNAAYEDWFGDLSTRVVAKLFHNKCEPYMERVAVSTEEFANLPSMKQISTNFSY